MSKKSVLLAVLLILSLLWGSAGEATAQPNPTPKTGGTITIGLNTDVTAVDPHVTTAFITATVLNHVFEPLVGHGEKMELVPVLAERWEVSSDYKTITFHLRKGKLFHNGREMVADDVKYSIERILDPRRGILGGTFSRRSTGSKWRIGIRRFST